MSCKITLSITPGGVIAWVLISVGAALIISPSVGGTDHLAGPGLVLVVVGKIVLFRHMLRKQTELQIHAFELGRELGAQEAGLRSVGH